MGQPLNRCAPVTGVQQCASRLLVLQVESLEKTALHKKNRAITNPQIDVKKQIPRSKMREERARER